MHCLGYASCGCSISSLLSITDSYTSVILASVFRLVAVYEVDTSPHVSGRPATIPSQTCTHPHSTENYALVFLWASVENHVGISAACAGALKTRWILTYRRVRKFSIDLKHKSRLPFSNFSYFSSTTSRAGTSTRRLSFERESGYASSATERSESNAGSLSDVDGVGLAVGGTELVDVHPGRRLEVVEMKTPKLVQVR
jgi:hypothetical protein